MPIVVTGKNSRKRRKSSHFLVVHFDGARPTSEYNFMRDNLDSSIQLSNRKLMRNQRYGISWQFFYSSFMILLLLLFSYEILLQIIEECEEYFTLMIIIFEGKSSDVLLLIFCCLIFIL